HGDPDPGSRGEAMAPALQSKWSGNDMGRGVWTLRTDSGSRESTDTSEVQIKKHKMSALETGRDGLLTAKRLPFLRALLAL
ncbi:hypothetical protein E4U43_000306, partial [Claviceps pusilla]